MGPFEFDVMMHHGVERNFYIHAENGKEQYEEKYGSDSYERRIQGIQNLCHQGLLLFNAESTREEDKFKINFSYWWSGLGNDVLHSLKIIDYYELLRRRNTLPPFFLNS
jgi:hypothetical protein